MFPDELGRPTHKENHVKLILVLLALLIPSGVWAQAHPSAEMLKSLPAEVYSAAKVADEVAAKVEAAYTKAFPEMKVTEANLRVAVEKEEDMDKLVLSHSHYLDAALVLIKSTDGLGEAIASVSKAYLKVSLEIDDLRKEMAFLDWLNLATGHQIKLRRESRVDDELLKAGSDKILSFIGQ